MDKILLGIAASTYPEGVKKALFLKMMSTASKPVSKEEVSVILQLSSHWVVSEDKFMQDIGLQIFQAWAKYNPTTYEDYFCHQFLISSFGESVSNPLLLIRFISDCLKTLHLKQETATKIVKTGLISLCRRFPEVVIQGEICRLLLANQDCIPESSLALTLCQTLITNTSILEIPSGDAELKSCMEAVGDVGHLLRLVWSRQPTTIIPSLQHVFSIISLAESTNPSSALGALVQHIHMNIVEAVTKSAVADVSITDERMAMALQRMIDWVSWPSVNIDKWIITFLTNLASVNKFTILIKVTLLTVEAILSRLCFPIVRDCAFNVFSHMLLSFQHSPDAFHKILGQIPELMERLLEEDTPSSRSFMSKVADLVYCLMYHHAGYPELYDPLLETLKEFPRPSETSMVTKLKQTAWTSQKGGLGTEFSSRFEPRSETGKTGLMNLGNTCYMNSVIQALFMTSKFCDDIVSYPLFNRQSIMYNLQLCFAFLTHTQRAAYAPRDFLRASRPPWFAPGSQQDCSEFLKYLLDRLDEEEKGWRKMLNNAAASITSSLSSPSSSPSGSSSPAPIAQGCTDGNDVKMETDAAGSSSEESSSSNSPSSSGNLLAPLSLSNMPVCHPTDELYPTATNSASCSSSVRSETTPLYNQAKSWSSPKFKKGDVVQPQESIVEKYFGGKSATHIRCLNCGTVSSRKETFFDLPLAFPGTEGRDNLLGGHSDTPAEERQSEKSDYASMELAQDSRSVVGASAIAAAVGPDLHSGSSRSASDSQGMAGSSFGATRTHLEDLLKHYFSPELLVKDNRYHCDKCQSLQDAEKSLEIINAPEILIITLLRFSYDVKLQRRCKIMEDVRYPRILHLDVNPCDGDCSMDGNHGGPCTKRTRQNSVGTAHCSTERDGDRTAQYVLSTVIVHSGMSSESGHYYCYACDDVDDIQRHLIQQKKSARNNGDGADLKTHETMDEEHLPNKWYLFNDSRVTASKFDSFGKVTQRFPRDTAYVLFYRKCDEEYDKGDPIDSVVQRAMPSSSSSSSSFSSPILKEKHLRKDLQDAIQKDNLHYIQEREIEAREAALRKQGPASAAQPFYSRNFDDKNDPPGGCGLGGGGGGGGPSLSSNRLVF